VIFEKIVRKNIEALQKNRTLYTGFKLIKLPKKALRQRIKLSTLHIKCKMGVIVQ